MTAHVCRKHGQLAEKNTYVRKDGYAECRLCRKERNRSNPEQAKRYQIKYGSTVKGHFTRLALNIRNRAKRKNLEFAINKELLIKIWEGQEGKCALTGIEMTHEKGKGTIPTVASVDRIDPSKGYTPHNIQLVCNQANKMKQDLTKEQLKMWCSAVLLE